VIDSSSELRTALTTIRRHDAAAWARAGRGAVWQVPDGYSAFCRYESERLGHPCGACYEARKALRRLRTGAA
jgi:hypothetical protein